METVCICSHKVTILLPLEQGERIRVCQGKSIICCEPDDPSDSEEFSTAGGMAL